MCQIQFTIETNDADGDSIQAVQMQYRSATTGGAWILEEYPGITNITNATIFQTPNLIAPDSYEFEIRVQDAKDDWSEWYSDPRNPTFEVGDCGNTPPTVNAGLDASIATNSITLNGIVTLNSGDTVESYSWVKETGLASTIAMANTATVSITDMEEGVHEFRFTATDNLGLTGTDTVKVTVKLVDTTPESFYVGRGKCEVIPADWTAVWTPSGNVADPYIPVVGDVFYTDSDFMTPYSSISAPHKLGFSPPPNIIISNKSYSIDDGGKITDIRDCVVTGGGNDAEIIGSTEETNCESCMSVRVNVPAGETREVSITRSGIARYSGGSTCNSGTVVISDINETISETKIYSFGLDAASGTETAQSSITLSVVGSNSIRLDRSHGLPVDIC